MTTTAAAASQPGRQQTAPRQAAQSEEKLRRGRAACTSCGRAVNQTVASSAWQLPTHLLVCPLGSCHTSVGTRPYLCTGGQQHSAPMPQDMALLLMPVWLLWLRLPVRWGACCLLPPPWGLHQAAGVSWTHGLCLKNHSGLSIRSTKTGVKSMPLALSAIQVRWAYGQLQVVMKVGCSRSWPAGGSALPAASTGWQMHTHRDAHPHMPAFANHVFTSRSPGWQAHTETHTNTHRSPRWPCLPPVPVPACSGGLAVYLGVDGHLCCGPAGMRTPGGWGGPGNRIEAAARGQGPHLM